VIGKRTNLFTDIAMAKKNEKQPDKKQVDKALKKVKEVCEQLKQCDKELKGALQIAKEVDKALG
jgi:hypothetical protein